MPRRKLSLGEGDKENSMLKSGINQIEIAGQLNVARGLDFIKLNLLHKYQRMVDQGKLPYLKTGILR